MFVGGAEALVLSATDSRLEIEAPPTAWLGATDIAVLRSDGRATSLRDAYVYDTFRRVTLRAGWNSVTWEGRPTRITAALAPIAANVRLAYVWDEAGSALARLQPDRAGADQHADAPGNRRCGLAAGRRRGHSDVAAAAGAAVGPQAWGGAAPQSQRS